MFTGIALVREGEKIAVDTRVPPWEASSYQLVTWWDMAKFQGDIFCFICSYLRGVTYDWEKQRGVSLTAEIRQTQKENLEYVAQKCEEAGLANTAGYIKDNLYITDIDGMSGDAFLRAFAQLPAMIESEMKRVEFLRVEKQQFYGSDPLFDPFVTDAFPQLTYDIVEAGNCLALERSTACVFHLMRIMELGVQEFGKKLGVPLVEETVWQKIMDQVNKRIEPMPEKPAAKKRRKETYAEVAGHLYNVKVAWRNTVMHPKKTYTPEEAEHLFTTVKMFMAVLTKLVKPTSAKAKRMWKGLPPILGTQPSRKLSDLLGGPTSS